LLVRHFAAKHGGPAVTFSDEALAALQRYSWPGNVRELENAVERFLILRSTDIIGVADLPDKVSGPGLEKAGRVVNLPPEGYPLEQLEREVVIEALERCDWNQTAAARFLSIPRHTLIYRMEKYAINPQERKK
jgi:DNA-binding NtrC family response regulator